MYEYKATVIRILDGDTVELDIDLGCKVHIREVCRLQGIDAPELRTPTGPAAKQWMEQATLDHAVLIRTVKDRTEKYGRYLVWLWCPIPAGTYEVSTTLNAEMVRAGHAVEYSGGKR